MRSPDPKGGGHGCPRAFDKHSSDGEYENPEGLSGRRIDLSGRPFLFGDFFFGPAKKSDSAAAADEGRRLLENTKSSRLQAALTERERVKVAGAPPTQG
jgi:hypothetical protein